MRFALDMISATSWTIAAIQDFNDSGKFQNIEWDWLCSQREAAEVTRRIDDGRLIGAQKRIRPGVYHLLVKLPKNHARIAEMTGPAGPLANLSATGSQTLSSRARRLLGAFNAKA